MFAAAFLLFAGLSLFANDTDLNDSLVYVTATGKSYHRADCHVLRNSKIEVRLIDAVNSGYAPCGICHPPEIARSVSAQSSAAPMYRVNLAKPEHSAAIDFSALVAAEVIDHIDGDTIRVRITNPPELLRTVETIRLLGVDTPEIDRSGETPEAFADEASVFTQERLFGKTVYLAFDWDLRDRYGRLLAYVYARDGLCHNTELIRQGYSPAYVRYAFRFQNEFLSYEQEARRKKQGLWK